MSGRLFQLMAGRRAEKRLVADREARRTNDQVSGSWRSHRKRQSISQSIDRWGERQETSSVVRDRDELGKCM